MDKSIILSNYNRNGIFLIPKNNPNNINQWIININLQEKNDSQFKNALKKLSKNKHLIKYLQKFN
tara:strand:+ start:100 stop:294 length:195 start_codon:yes stop_codon:yes gene_type:complete